MGALVGVQILNYVLPIITIPIIVRIIGPANFGTINYISSIVTYFVLFIGFSFELSASRIIAMNQDDSAKVNAIFSKVFFAKVGLFFISTIIFAGLLMSSKDLQKDLTVSIYTYLICLGSIFDCNYLYTAKQDLKQTAFFNLITKVILNLSLLYFIREKDDYILQPLLMSLAQIIVGGTSFFWAIKKYHIKIIFNGIYPIWIMLWADKTLFFHSFAHTLYTTINIVMLGYFEGVTEVGYYTAGWKLIILIQALLISPLGLVLFPIIGQAFGNSKEEGLKIIQKMLPIVLIASFLIALSILIFGGLTVRIFYGEKFIESIHIFRLLSFMPMMLILNMLLGIQAMVNLKMDNKLFTITLFAALVNIVLNLVFIKSIGSSGAAISWFLTETFCTMMMFWVLKKNNIQLIKYEYFNSKTIFSNVLPLLEKVKSKFNRNAL